MTKTELESIFFIIETLIEKEVDLSERFIELNPSWKGWRENIKSERTSAMWDTWLAIVDRYKDVWKGND